MAHALWAGGPAGAGGAGKASGRYLTLSKVLLRHKATRLLSPALEEQACAAATEQNYRPAARSLSRWIGTRLSAWLVRTCVQYHGERLRENDFPHRPWLLDRWHIAQVVRTLTRPGRIPSLDAPGLERRQRGQGRSWDPVRAERLLQLKRLLAEPQRWSEWWKSRPQFHLKLNPP